MQVEQKGGYSCNAFFKCHILHEQTLLKVDLDES